MAGSKLSDNSSMPMTDREPEFISEHACVAKEHFRRTLIDSLKLADNVETHFREFILEQMQEEGQ